MSSHATVVVRPHARARLRRVSATQPLWRSRTAIALAGVTLVAFAVRLLVTRGIWLDEAISVHQAQLSFGDMLAHLRTTDRLPPLHHSVLWLVTRVFGPSELAVRLPSIVAGTLVVPMLYLAGRELYDRTTGLLAAAAAAVAPFVVWYAQEARMYAFFMLFAVVALWAQARAIRRGDPLDWVLYAVATAALLWTHYFAILHVVVQQVAFGAVAWHRARGGLPLRRFVVASWLASVGVIVAVIPLMPLVVDQFAANEAAGAGFTNAASQGSFAAGAADTDISIYAVVSNATWAIWGYHSDAAMASIASLWPLVMLLVLWLLGRGRSAQTLFLIALAVVPPLVLLGVGFVKRDLFEVRYFAGAVPVVLLLFARATTAWSASRAARAVVAGGLLASLVVATADQQLNGTNPRLYDFRGALAEVAERARPNDLVVYEPHYLRYVVDYYVPQLNARPLRRGVPSLERGRRVFVVASFLDKREHAARAGEAVYELNEQGRLVEQVGRHEIRTWIFRP